MPRLFAGIELPTEIIDKLERLRRPLPSTRWIEAENLHITLRFFGDVTPPVARELTANLANIAFKPFPIRLNGLDTFGGDDPRTLFASAEPSESLLNLARDTETAARRAGIKPDSRKFVPHVTLARLQAPRIDPIARFLSRQGSFHSEPIYVSQFALFSSKPHTGGGPYVVEHVFPSTMGAFDDFEWDEAEGADFDSDPSNLTQ
jgi:2'-5' RNA ligase